MNNTYDGSTTVEFMGYDFEVNYEYTIDLGQKSITNLAPENCQEGIEPGAEVFGITIEQDPYQHDCELYEIAYNELLKQYDDTGNNGDMYEQLCDSVFEDFEEDAEDAKTEAALSAHEDRLAAQHDMYRHF